MHHLLTILLLFPLFAHAQDTPTTFQDDHLFGPTYWASAADSVDFTAFLSALQLTDPGQDGDSTSVTYHLVWRKNQHGGVAVVSRGDGSALRVAARTLIGFYENHPFHMPDGRRGVVMIHDEPCALICRDTVYYVEDRP